MVLRSHVLVENSNLYGEKEETKDKSVCKQPSRMDLFSQLHYDEQAVWTCFLNSVITECLAQTLYRLCL